MGFGGMHRTRVVALAGVLAVLATACWGGYGAGYDNSRVAVNEMTISKTSAGSLHELWRVDGAVGNTSTPMVLGNTVYFGGWDGKLRAVNATTGAAVWTTQLSTAGIDDSPTVSGNAIYIGDGTGTLHAVDLATGAPLWSRDLDSHPNARLYSSPVVVDGIVVVGVASTELALVKANYTFRGSIVGLDATTGAELWRTYTTNDDAIGGAGVSVWSTAAIDRPRHLAFIGTGQDLRAPRGPAQRRADGARLPDRRDSVDPPVHDRGRLHDLRAVPRS